MATIDPPGPLAERGLRLWDGVMNKYSLRIDEEAILFDACREMDLIDRMESHQKIDDLIGKGSQGQDVAAPMISELRQHRTTFATLMNRLHLPDEDGRVAAHTSSQARAAINTRWGRSG